MKAILSRIMSSSSVVLGPFSLFPILYILLVLCLGYTGTTVGMFLMFLSCIVILPSSKGMMFEASMPGRRSKTISARYIMALIIVVFYAILMAMLGHGGEGPDQFGFKLFFMLFLISLEYPFMFLCPEKLKGFMTGILSAFLVITLNPSKGIWPNGGIGDFLIWIACGLVVLAISHVVTVKLYEKRGVTC